LSNLVDLCQEDYYAPKIKITYTHIYLPFQHWSAHKHTFPSTKIFYSYTGRKHKSVLVGIIALCSLKSISQYFLVIEGRYVAMQNKSIEKRKDKCPKQRKRIAHTILCKDH